MFDLDGTLTDPRAGITRSVSYALEAFGIRTASLDSLTGFIGPPLSESFMEFYGFSEAEAAKAIGKYREYYTEKGMYEDVLYGGIAGMLAQLKEKGVSLAIATSKPTVYAGMVAERLDFKRFFDLIAGSELDGTRVRKGEVIGYALGILDPERKMPTLMIGDRKHDIIGAREMGLDCIAVSWGYGSRSELEAEKPFGIADSPDELCGMILGGQ